MDRFTKSLILKKGTFEYQTISGNGKLTDSDGSLYEVKNIS